MAERQAQPVPNLPATDAMQIVTTASQAQAAKVREILTRLDALAALDPMKVESVSRLLNAAKADGGCGIGCW